MRNVLYETKVFVLYTFSNIDKVEIFHVCYMT